MKTITVHVMDGVRASQKAADLASSTYEVVTGPRGDRRVLSRHRTMGAADKARARAVRRGGMGAVRVRKAGVETD